MNKESTHTALLPHSHEFNQARDRIHEVFNEMAIRAEKSSMKSGE